MLDDEPLRLYPFRKQDPLTGKWYRARWKASLQEIAANGWTVDGPAVPIGSHGATSDFMHPTAQDPRPQPPLPDIEPPRPNRDERWLARLFLRRYVTYCARSGRESHAIGAATLWRELATS